MIKPNVLLMLTILLLVAAQCRGEQPSPDTQGDQSPIESAALSVVNLAEGEKLKVVATTNIIGDMVKNVGGNNIALTTLLPVGSDPHTFVPTPQDIARVADAHVIFVNGLHLEEFLEELINNAGSNATVITVSTQVKTRELSGGAARENEAVAEHNPAGEQRQSDQEDHLEGTDPHIWMTPANAVIMVRNIERTLSQLDPANAASYQANAEAYETQLEELDVWVQAQIDSIPADNRKLVTDHDSFGYYVDRYGLVLVGAVLPGYSTNAEPSAQEMVALQDAIADLGVKAVFVGTTVNPVLAERMAEDTGIQLIPLYTGSLGEPGSGAETYLDYIRYNTTAIVEALQ